ncbi:MAG: NlpC/P60 family protein [Sciscionella sp.]
MLKIAVSATVGLLIVIAMLGAALAGVISALFGGGSLVPSHTARTDIPADYLALYQRAATVCPGLNWAVLAAIGKVETDHGRSTLPGVHTGHNYAGAGGPMQFLQTTFDTVLTRHRIPPGGMAPPSRYNPHDAIYAAAFYLCDSGARDGRDLRAAIYTYNRATWYVEEVLAQADLYRDTPTRGGTPPNQAALAAVRYAQDQLGQPYVWGGDSDAEGGFDCSGLTTAAYQAAGITLPRTAQAQHDAGPPLPPGTPLQPGDLVFYGTGPTHITHVGLIITPTHMINAPHPGAVIRIDPIGHYLAATRPAAGTGTA